MKIDSQELDEKSKTKFGKYTPSKENSAANLFYRLFLKSTSTRSFVNGAITVSVLFLWWQNDLVLPLIIWGSFLIFVNLSALVYWHHEKRRLDKEIKQTEAELAAIQDEIKDRKDYFNKVKEELSKGPDQDTPE